MKRRALASGIAYVEPSILRRSSLLGTRLYVIINVAIGTSLGIGMKELGTLGKL